MNPKRSEYIPELGLETGEMKRMQREIGAKAVFHDNFSFGLDNLQDLTVVGVDQGFTEDKPVSVAVAVKNGEVIEEVSAAEDTPIPYIPGLLAFREGGAIVKALKKLEINPDLLILDGSGRIHFRQAGIATHIGVIFDVPSIGVAKKLLCGKVDLPEKMQKGEKRKIFSDDRVEGLDNEVIGYAYQSKQYSSPKRSINPLYISPGHRFSSETSVKIVSKFCKGYKLPEPTRLADKKVSEVKQKYS